MIGALGDASVKGSEAGTTLRSVLSSLQAPNKNGRSALRMLGIDTKDKAGNMRPIEEILAQMDKAMDKKFGKDKNGNRRAELLKGLFDEANAANASLLIAKAGSGDLKRIIADNKAALGTAASVAADMSNNTAGAAKELDSALEELQLTIGEALLPSVTELLKTAKDITAAVTAWTAEHPTLTTAIGYTIGALGILGIGLWGTVAAVGAATTAWGVWITFQGYAAKAAMATTRFLNILKAASLTNPVTLIIMGIATAALLIYEYWDPISEFFSGLWENVTAGFKSALDWILDKIGWVGEKIEAFKVSVMSEEDAAAYAAAKGAEFEQNKQGSALFADNLDSADPNSQTRTGSSRFEDTNAAANDAKYAMNQIAAALNNVNPSTIERRGQDVVDFGNMTDGLAAYHAKAQGKELLPGQTGTRTVKGDMVITVRGTGEVVKTDLTKQAGDFETRMNRGGQAA